MPKVICPVILDLAALRRSGGWDHLRSEETITEPEGIVLASDAWDEFTARVESE